MNKLLRYGAIAVLATAGTNAAYAGALDNTKLGGKMYFDMSNISQKLNGTSAGKDGFGFDVKRFYFSVNHKFDDVWSVNLTTDFHYSSAGGKSSVFVKKAYVQGNFAPLFKLRAGSTDMPWIPYVEHLYGFRYVENTVTDRFGYANSADWGVHALGKQGIFDYQVSLVSGAGYSHVNARSKRPDIAVRVGVHPIKGTTFAVGYYNGKRGLDTAAQQLKGPTNTQTRLDFVAAYVGHGLRVGGEYFNEKNPVKYKSSNLGALPSAPGNSVTGPSDKASGYSVWTSYEVTDPITVFARYDRVKMSKTIDPSLKDTYYNVGAQYKIRKGIVASLVYKHERMHDNLNSQRYNEIGIFSQIKF